MRFSTILLASASLLGLTCAAPDHKLALRQAVTNSSTTASSTSASSTSSGTTLPTVALATFNLAVQPASGSKAKRQTSGYIGLNAANNLVVVSASASASVFSNVGGQLTTGGLAVFAPAASVAAPGYTVLSVEAVTGVTTDITTTFGGSGAIVFANPAFTGNAVFFVLNGVVYAAFNGVALPAGAVVVSLVPVSPAAVSISTSINVSVTVSVTVTVSVNVQIIAGVLVKNTQTVTQTIYQACNTYSTNGVLTTITYYCAPTYAVTTIPVVTKTVTSLGSGVTTVVVGGATSVVVATATAAAGATVTAVVGGGSAVVTTAAVAAGGATATTKAVYTGAAAKNAAGSLAVLGAGLAFFL